jgi:hypothetical protein
MRLKKVIVKEWDELYSFKLNWLKSHKKFDKKGSID